jgi:hypothetical protein
MRTNHSTITPVTIQVHAAMLLQKHLRLNSTVTFCPFLP